MTPDPVCIAPGDTVAVAAALMRERRVTRLPVVADGLLVGVISRFDLLAALVARLARDEAAMPSDTDIQDDIEMALNRETWVPKSGIRVTVQDGHVVLTGVIMSDYERRAVRLIAENVFGVVSVTDNMVFAGPAGDGSIHVA